MKRVLSIDGGGIRGVIPARILSLIEERVGPIAKKFDLIGGTSTGGILAAGLAHPLGYSAADLLHLYVEHGPLIFKRAWYEVAGLFKVKYPATGIETVLQAYYRDNLLAESLTSVLITAYDIANAEPRFFKSRKAKADPTNNTENVALWYAARCTSAAPTYFPDKDGFVDGGVFASDPGMCTYAEARAMWPDEEIMMVSIGTGYRANPIDPKEAAGWGGLHWISPVINVLMDGNAANVEYQLRQLLPAKRYVRLQAPITGTSPDHAMDNATPGNVKALIAFADQIYWHNTEDIDRIVEALK